MLTTHGERLTGRAARDNVDLSSNGSEIKLARVHFMKWPSFNSVRMVSLVLSKCLAGVVVPFDNGGVTKSRRRHPYGKTARACEKLNASHRETSARVLPASRSAATDIPKS
jgi:hypothetical protein